ncbi:hypothetical protein NX059_001723 [Plenodomus lindquistii]|nr:hypothetical protein NX059_001723 [Plenodomus lindquistii]
MTTTKPTPEASAAEVALNNINPVLFNLTCRVILTFVVAILPGCLCALIFGGILGFITIMLLLLICQALWEAWKWNNQSRAWINIKEKVIVLRRTSWMDPLDTRELNKLRSKDATKVAAKQKERVKEALAQYEKEKAQLRKDEEADKFWKALVAHGDEATRRIQ